MILSRLRRLFRDLATGLRGLYWKAFLKSLGTGTRFYGPVFISRPEFVRIGAHCTLNRDLILNGRAPITIGDHVRIAARVIINSDGLDYEGPREKRDHTFAPVVVQNGAWIGAGAIINPGVTIGEDAAVAAGSVVLKDVPPRTLVFGSPARIVRSLEHTP